MLFQFGSLYDIQRRHYYYYVNFRDRVAWILCLGEYR